jgi:hypothetical protein
MCNLYSETKGQAPIRALFRTPHDRTGNLPGFLGIFPDQMAPIVRHGADGERELVLARWGMPGARPSPAGRISTRTRLPFEAASRPGMQQLFHSLPGRLRCGHTRRKGARRRSSDQGCGRGEAGAHRGAASTEPEDPDSDPAVSQSKTDPITGSGEVDPGMDSGWEISHLPSSGTRRSPRR